MSRFKLLRFASWTLIGLMVVQSVSGLLFSNEYRDAAWIVATWWGNDLVTLCVVVPLFAVALVWSCTHSGRGLLLWAGSLAYAVYNYAYYMLGAELNRFFILYILCFVIASGVLIVLIAHVDVNRLTLDFDKRTPVTWLGGYFMFVATGLSLVWIGTWASYAFAGKPTPVETGAFQLVAALDLTLMVPVLAAGGYLLARKQPWGYLISSISGLQATLYLLVLTVNSGVAIKRGLVEAPGELVIWAPLLIATGFASILLLFSVRDNRTERSIN